MSGQIEMSRKPNIEEGEVFEDQTRGGLFWIKYADEEIVVLSEVDGEGHRFNNRRQFKEQAVPSENGVQDPRYKLQEESIQSETESDSEQSGGSQNETEQEAKDEEAVKAEQEAQKSLF